MLPAELTCKIVGVVPLQDHNGFVLSVRDLDCQSQKLLTLRSMKEPLSVLEWCFESGMCIEVSGLGLSLCWLQVRTSKVVIVQEDILWLLVVTHQIRGPQTGSSKMLTRLWLEIAEVPFIDLLAPAKIIQEVDGITVSVLCYGQGLAHIGWLERHVLILDLIVSLLLVT